MTPDAPHSGGRPPLPGTAPHHPRGTQPPQGMQARGTVLGPRTHTPAPTARGWRTPTARPVEGQNLTSDAPHTMVEGTPLGDALSATPTASNAGPQERTLWGRCWVPTRAPTAPGTHGADQAWGPRTAAHQNSMDAATHMTPHDNSSLREGRGGFRSAGAPGGAVHRPPLIPPHPGPAPRP